MNDIDSTVASTFPGFFGLCAGVVGNEANYQAILYRALANEFGTTTFREYKDPLIGKGSIDVSVTSSLGGRLAAACELKGGAYNVRNALQDTFNADGYCRDMERLAALSKAGVSSWMVAIDAVELGRSLNHRALHGAAENCRSRGIGFAYHAHGDKTAVVLHPAGQLHYVDVPVLQNEAVAYQALRQRLITPSLLAARLGHHRASLAQEADIVGQLYIHLLDGGCSARQVSLETYFNFAPGRGMQQRPDLCIFEPDICGRFNLYSKGDASKSNDRLKLEHLRCLWEVKGGLALGSKRDSSLLRTYLGDIEKLAHWREILEEEKQVLGVSGSDVECRFLAVDFRGTALNADARGQFEDVANEKHVVASYFHLPI